MARRVARPLALRVTWLVAPWPITAHVMTFAALLTALGSAAAFGRGTLSGWLCGVGLLQLWYLLDHVDGQLARWHQTESLDGVALDYLMHHAVNLIVPCGLGWGFAWSNQEPGWMLAGTLWGCSTLLLGLLDDVRYKAFIQRLKRVEGELRVVGGGGGRPQPASAWPRQPRAMVTRIARKSCEMHVTMNSLTLLAALAWLLGDTTLLAGRVFVAAMALISATTFALSLWRALRKQSAEQEFALWFSPPASSDLVNDGHWWKVQASPSSPNCETARDGSAKPGHGRLDRGWRNLHHNGLLKARSAAKLTCGVRDR